jgi:hypothetical protein
MLNNAIATTTLAKTLRIWTSLVMVESLFPATKYLDSPIRCGRRSP